MIILISLVCPNGHPNGGTPLEFAGAQAPPPDWYNQHMAEFVRLVKENRENWAKCTVCKVALSNQWQIIADEMKAQTLEEAFRDLAALPG